jgi:hypothetical protein
VTDEPHDEDGFLSLPDAATLRKLKAMATLDRHAEKRIERSRGRRPITRRDDRRHIPAVLKQWRRVHGLTQHEAQVRVGYSDKSNMWALWESGRFAPPYEALLRIIAATGIGHWTDRERLSEIDPTLRLEVLTANEEAKKRR